MTKVLLGIICFLACVFSMQAQTLYGTTLQGGNGGGTINKFIPGANSLTIVKSFESSAANPQFTNLIQATDGRLYGMTSVGGDFGAGVIFSFDPSTSTYTELKDFDNTNGANPYGSLVQASDGKLYGMTRTGGNGGYGVIFSFDLSSSTYAKLDDFDYDTKGANPNGSLIQASDGKLYGMTPAGGSGGGGVIFSFDPSSSNYTKLKDFDFLNFPFGSLMQASDGKLYGMTSGGGIGLGNIFSFDPLSFIYTSLVDFDIANGAFPVGNLLQASDGKLYGMTPWGGSSSAGVIFSFDPSTSTYIKLKDFDQATGKGPNGGLIQASDGNLYGMTGTGGSTDAGVIFSFAPSSSTYTKLNDFDYPNGGGQGGSLMQASDQKLYGLTSRGGSSNAGTLFSFEPSISTFTKLKDFGINEDGVNVLGGLTQANDGKLYGMTGYGGSGGYGIIFSVDPSTSTYTKLKDFDFINGGFPVGNLIKASDGKLYGVTPSGGSSGLGVIFSIDPSTSVYTKLKDFDGKYTGRPVGSLTQASDGKLYGMTSGEGAVIFSFDPSISTYTELFQYIGEPKHTPEGSLIQASDGKLYGVTRFGGNNSYGVIFSFDLSTSTYTKLNDFDYANGAWPSGSLMQASDGKLYGMTFIGGTSNAGVIFSYDPFASTYTKLKDFETTDGAAPNGSLIQASDGKLYGITSLGGSSGYGVIFSFDLSSSTFTKLQDYNGANGASPGVGSSFTEVYDCKTPRTFYRDADDDGYGDPNKFIKACTQPFGFVTNGIDCDDDQESDKVLICHKGNTLCVSQHAVAAHLSHGDTEGPCRYPITSANRENKDITNDQEVSESNLIVAAEYKLSNNPNPFAGRTTIKYELPFNSKLSIKIYDIMGRIVATLIDGDKKAGAYTVDFEPGNLGSGPLYYRMIATSKDKQFMQTNKMIKLQ